MSLYIGSDDPVAAMQEEGKALRANIVANEQAKRGGMQEGLRRRNHDHAQVNNPGGIRKVPDNDDDDKKPKAIAWVPGGYAKIGQPAVRGHEFKPGPPARGPHLAYRKDYHRYRAHDEEFFRYRKDGHEPRKGEARVGAAVEPALGVGFQGGEMGGVRPFVGIHGVQADRLDAWALKKPAGNDPWVPKYPKRIVPHGPMDAIPPGHARIGPDRVGPVAEFNERRVDRRGHARGHAHVDVERVGVFPKHGPPPHLVAERHAGARPVDPEDASRAVPAYLNERRLGAVRRAWAVLDAEGSGKVAVEDLITKLKYARHRKRMDFTRRDDVLVAMDDLEEQLSQTLLALVKTEGRDVRITSAFMPSACGHASRVGHASGRIKLKEFERCYERIGCMVHDDAFFEELIDEAWGLGPATPAA